MRLSNLLGGWFFTFLIHLNSLEFKASQADPSLFTYNKKGKQLYILLWVDDILITRNNIQAIQTLIKQLSTQFSIKNLGLASTFLGFQITHTTNCYFINQTQYALNVEKKVGLSQAKPIMNCLPSKVKHAEEQIQPFVNWNLYCMLTRSL